MPDSDRIAPTVTTSPSTAADDGEAASTPIPAPTAAARTTTTAVVAALDERFICSPSESVATSCDRTIMKHTSSP